MAQATLSDWYNSRAWDEPENLEFPAVAIKFDDLSAWFKYELKSDGYDRLDAALIADDAVDFYLVGYYSQPDIIYPANACEVYAALDAAKELFLQEG